MNFKQLMIAAIAATAMSTAFADGPLSAYDGEQDLALSPGEQADVTRPITLNNGATEDPRAPASSTARAYWHGMQSGRQAQKQEDMAKNVPPLPPLPPEMQPVQPKGYAGYPQAAQVQAIPQQQPEQQYAPPPQYRQRQQPTVQVVNVMPDPRYYEPAEQYGRAPSWRNRDMYSEQSYEYAQPAPVYQEPQVVYAPPPPPVIVQQPVYVQRAYPAYPPRYYAPPYYQDHGYVGVRGRGWGVRMGW